MTVRADEGGEESKLHAAIRVHNLKLVRAALCDEGLDIDAVGVYGWTALHEAASCGHQDIVLILLDHGADPDIQDSVQKCTPIHFAARNGHLEVVRSLVRSGARIDLRNAAGKIPQDWADEQCREFLQRERKSDEEEFHSLTYCIITVFLSYRMIGLFTFVMRLALMSACLNLFILKCLFFKILQIG